MTVTRVENRRPALDLEGSAWVAAILMFGVGDVVTTLVGISAFGAVELSPVAGPVVETIGLWALVPLKAATLVAFYGLFAYTPTDYREGVPLGLSLVGAAAVGWNSVVLVVAGAVA